MGAWLIPLLVSVSAAAPALPLQTAERGTVNYSRRVWQSGDGLPEDLAQAIAEDPTGLLLLQSETAEQGVIELAGRLKRLFGEEIRVLLLSADYQTAEEAGGAADAFVQYPAAAEEVRRVIAALGDTSRRILLIDDSKLVHNHIVPPLRDQGYQVFQAFDGAEVVRRRHLRGGRGGRAGRLLCGGLRRRRRRRVAGIHGRWRRGRAAG